MTNYIGQLEPFVAGSNFESYEDRVRQFLKANKIVEDDMKTSVFISIMGQEVYDTLKSLTLPDKPSSKSFDDLSTIFGGHFAPSRNKRAERYKFNKAVQESGESISEFIVKLKTLAQTCKFGEFTVPVKVTEKVKVQSKKDEEVIEVKVDEKELVTNCKLLILDDVLTDRFIVGLHNQKIQQRLLNKDSMTFEECCLIATNMELAEKESEAIQPKSFVNKVSTTRGHSKSRKRGRSMSRNRNEGRYEVKSPS